MIRFVLAIALYYGINLSAQGIDRVSKAEIRSVLESVTDAFTSKLSFVNTLKQPLNIEVIRKLDSSHILLSPTDLLFLETQISNYKPIVLDSSYLPHANFMDGKDFETVFAFDSLNSQKDGWDIFYKKYGLGYYMISYPLFNKKKNICIFYLEMSVGSLGGSGEIRIYKRRKNAWKLYKIKSMWDS